MYGWIWRHLPGPLAVKVLISLVIAAGVLTLLWLFVFPWVEHLLPLGAVTI